MRKSKTAKDPQLVQLGHVKTRYTLKTIWDDYAGNTKISGREYVTQLLQYCDDTLRRDLVRNHGSLVNKAPDAVTQAIESPGSSGRQSNVSEIHSAQHTHDEGIHSYVARVRGQAAV